MRIFSIRIAIDLYSYLLMNYEVSSINTNYSTVINLVFNNFIASKVFISDTVIWFSSLTASYFRIKKSSSRTLHYAPDESRTRAGA